MATARLDMMKIAGTVNHANLRYSRGPLIAAASNRQSAWSSNHLDDVDSSNVYVDGLKIVQPQYVVPP
ncbi:hypothetical protein LTR53_015426 [Teratosphaeriaceae sp. CCFEE 6253]|nr:hypothetical protein LTR53_015426 [Teratosphaeriaceae sp. CCFEE 6253]